MLQEMKLPDALKKFSQGRTVLLMEQVDRAGDGVMDYLVTDLKDVFAGARFLVEVPAVENPDVKAAFPPPCRK